MTSTTQQSTQNLGNLSGAHWSRRFVGSQDTTDLTGSFRHAVEDFIHAMREAGINVRVEATHRPVKRSYLMHWSWRIVNSRVDPASIPPLSGVDINWVHSTDAASRRAAQAMVSAFSMDNLLTAPALRSEHNLGLAIDMTISWRGTVTVRDGYGAMIQIGTTPRNGLNRQLAAIGASYGVKKYHGGNRDIPHWSSTGR